jgi:thioredoxin-related protein
MTQVFDATVAALISFAIVFSIGLLIISLCGSKTACNTVSTGSTTTSSPASPNNATVSAPQARGDMRVKQGFPKPTNLIATMEEVDVSDLVQLVESIPVDTAVSLVFYSTGCPWCKRFKEETIEPLQREGKLPFPVKLVMASSAMRKHIDESSKLRAIAGNVKGLPTTVVLYQRGDGLYAAPLVGFLDKDAFMQRVAGLEQTATKVE